MKTPKEIIIETLQGEGLMYAYRDFADDIKDEHIEKIADKIVKKLNISTVIKSVCENCSNTDFNETMGCRNYLQGFKCENFKQTGL